MIKLENTEAFGWESAIRGMRNPMNSWDKSDSYYCDGNDCPHVDFDTEPAIQCVGTNTYDYCIGKNDLKLMQNLAKAGSDHAKYLRMINVTVDITAPLFWWKEFDTYKVGTVANSCSTMHKIMAKEFTANDFSWDAILKHDGAYTTYTLDTLNELRNFYVDFDYYKEKDLLVDEITKKDIWRILIEALPSSYNQRRTVQMNYQVLWNIYNARKNHKLHEWHTLCDWIETLPYFKEIFGIDDNVV